jgi:hypothetical protein
VTEGVPPLTPEQQAKIQAGWVKILEANRKRQAEAQAAEALREQSFPKNLERIQKMANKPMPPFDPSGYKKY